MKLLIIFFIIKVISCTQYVLDVNTYHEPMTSFDKSSKTVKYCIYMNNRTLDVKSLVGTWYTIFKFAKNLVGAYEHCKSTNFTLPTKEDVDAYKAKYNLQNESFTFDDSVIIGEPQGNNTTKGIVVGNKTAKYYFLDPKSQMRLMGMYDVFTYKPVNNNYMIHYDCKMRGHVKYLLSRRKDQTEEELKKILEPLYELADLGKARYCYKRKVVSTTPYF